MTLTKIQTIASGTGATFRTVDNHLRDVVSVKDFGAVGDGVTNDTSAIQAAFNSISTYSSVYFPPGVYLLSANITATNKKAVLNGATFTGGFDVQTDVIESFEQWINGTDVTGINKKGSNIGVGTPANNMEYNKGGVLIGAGHSTGNTGSWISCDGATNWLNVAPNKNYNPQEFIIYNSGGSGYATTNSGGGTITRNSGEPFQTSWVGDQFYFLRKVFKIKSVSNENTLEVEEEDGTAVNFPNSTDKEAYTYSLTSGTGTCTVSGTTVTYVSGDPFVPNFFHRGFEFSLQISGAFVAQTLDANADTGGFKDGFNTTTQQYKLSSAPSAGDGTYNFQWKGNINDQLSTLRVQAIAGDDEENVNIIAYGGNNVLGRYYSIETGFAGTNGKMRPLFIGSGNYTDFTYAHHLGCHPRDDNNATPFLQLGGVQGRETLTIFGPSASNVTGLNRFEIHSCPGGFAPAIRASGSDTNIGMGFDTTGNGDFGFTQGFARTLFKMYGDNAASVNHIASIARQAGQPVELFVQGTDTNVDFIINAKGSGVLRFGTHTSQTGGTIDGFITIKDAAGNTHKLATIA